MVTPIEPARHTEAPPTGAVPSRRPVRRRPVVAPPPSAEAALVARAAEVMRARAGNPPGPWRLPGFARGVDLVRRQLGPLRELGMLVASYERESARLAAMRRLAANPAAPPPPLDPLEAAYAVRWLELSDGGMALPAWAVFIGDEGEAAG
jgi:hypothetical protein